VKLRYLKIGELETYLNSQEYQNTTIVPITAQRVHSHIQNPRAELNDIALIIAEEENGNVLAFIGLLPDFILVPEKEKVFWISCWWSHPEKGNSLGIPLLLAALQVSNNKLLADATPDTLSVFQKSKLFHIPKTKKGLKLFMKPLVKKVLLRKKSELERFASALDVTDWLISFLHLPFKLLNSFVYRLPKNIVIERISSNEIQNINTENYFQRNEKEIEWVENNPWVLAPNEYLEKRLYPFSTVADSFKNHFLRIKENGKAIGTLWLTEREGVFKLPYLWHENGKELAMANGIMNFLSTNNATEFTTFHPQMTKTLAKMNLPFVFKHSTSYQYVWGKKLSDSLNLDFFQDGDGDAIFT